MPKVTSKCAKVIAFSMSARTATEPRRKVHFLAWHAILSGEAWHARLTLYTKGKRVRGLSQST